MNRARSRSTCSRWNRANSFHNIRGLMRRPANALMISAMSVTTTAVGVGQPVRKLEADSEASVLTGDLRTVARVTSIASPNQQPTSLTILCAASFTLLVLLVPVTIAKYPALVDFPNHLARHYIGATID